jgi:hypothetical protein
MSPLPSARTIPQSDAGIVSINFKKLFSSLVHVEGHIAMDADQLPPSHTHTHTRTHALTRRWVVVAESRVQCPDTSCEVHGE